MVVNGMQRVARGPGAVLLVALLAACIAVCQAASWPEGYCKTHKCPCLRGTVAKDCPADAPDCTYTDSSPTPTLQAFCENPNDPPKYHVKGGLTGDPHFVGYNGVRFKFDGEPGKYFALLSSSEVQLNAKFTQHLMVRKRDEDNNVAVTTNGTFITAIGLSDVLGNAISLTLVPTEATTGTRATISVAVNGRTVGSTDTLQLPESVEVKGDYAGNGAHRAAVTTPHVAVHVRVGTDCEVEHLALSVDLHGVEGRVEGVMGEQYAAPTVHPRDEAPWQDVLKGQVADYVVSGIFANDFAYNQFGLPLTATADVQSERRAEHRRSLIEGRAARPVDITFAEFAMNDGYFTM